MSAGEAVRRAIVGGLRARPEFAGVDGLLRDTAANALPQASVEAGTEGDWSTKTADGREVRVVTTIRVARGQAMRLPAMVVAAQAVGSVLSGNLDGWHVGSAVMVRARSFDGPEGIKAAIVEHRVRLLAD